MVLKNIVLDESDDLLLALTNVDDSAFAATAQLLKGFVHGFYRVVS